LGLSNDGLKPVVRARLHRFPSRPSRDPGQNAVFLLVQLDPHALSRNNPRVSRIEQYRLVALRIFQGDKAEDKRAIPGVLTGIVMHPLAEYDGQMKIMEWSRLREVPGAPHGVIIEAAKDAEEKLVNAICQ
jgi:hypothetical protein